MKGSVRGADGIAINTWGTEEILRKGARRLSGQGNYKPAGDTMSLREWTRRANGHWEESGIAPRRLRKMTIDRSGDREMNDTGGVV